jgi:phosphoribosylglycinamide formyltransferase 1
MELRLGFLASHNGSNLQAILESIKSGYLKAEPRVLITNNPDAKALKIAEEMKLPRVCLNNKDYPQLHASLDDAIAETLGEMGVNLVVLAGYMKKLGPATLSTYKNRILNIHPALLPKYGGEGMYGWFVHQEVLKADERESGATVHLVDQEYDRGPIIAREKVPVLAGDTVDDLAKRVLEVEHKLYSKVLRDIQLDRIDLDLLAKNPVL